MGIEITSATWGDENHTTPVETTLRSQAEKGYLDVVASASLVPAVDLLTGVNKIELTDAEMAVIRIMRENLALKKKVEGLENAKKKIV
jgi:hypothetical protein